MLSVWVNNKLTIATALEAGALGGTYSEAGLIIGGVLSGLASIAWPGRVKDRCRFVEACVRLSDPLLRASRVSIPLLVRGLEEDGHLKAAQEVKALRARLLAETDRVVTDDEIDAEETEVLKCPALANKKGKSIVRRHSYANLLYTQVRCGLSHEYELGDGASAYPMASARVSYVNMMHEPDRKIHFRTAWLCDLARSVAARVEAAASNQPPIPVKWWLEEQ